MENHSAEMTSLGETNVNLDDVIESLYPNGYVTRSILYPGTSRNGRTVEFFLGEHEDEYLECCRSDGKKNGLGLLFKQGKLHLKCSFVSDILHGWGVIYENGIALIEGYWDNGVFQKNKIVLCSEQEIVLEERDEDGVLLYRGGFDCSTYSRHGFGTIYEEGRLCGCGQFDHNRMICLYKSFDGKMMSEFDELGNLIYEGEYVNEMCHQFPRNGHGREFVDNHIVYDGSFSNNRRDGFGISYYDNGVASFKGIWKDNHPVEGRRVMRDGFYEGVTFDGRFEFTVDNAPALEVLNETVTSFSIPDYCCNEESFQSFSLHDLPHLQDVTIGNHSCANVRIFTVVELPMLESLMIGSDSFTKCDHGSNMPWMNDNPCRIATENRSFSVTKCPKLRQIAVGIGSFSDYVLFDFSYLNALTALILGNAENTGGYDVSSLIGHWCEEFTLKGMCWRELLSRSS